MLNMTSVSLYMAYPPLVHGVSLPSMSFGAALKMKKDIEISFVS
jgi:hypothetical protein